MIVIRDKSIKMPSRFSYYVSNFSEDIKEELRKSAPFASYNRQLKKYEVTQEVLDKIKCIEDIELYTDNTVMTSEFVRRTFDKYGYQKDAVNFSKDKLSILINFEQGMGKSFTTMKILQNKNLKRTLIVCGQSNLQEEWLKDARKHKMDEILSFDIVGGIDASTLSKVRWLNSKALKPGTDLINVEALRNDSVLSAIESRKYQCIVVDEVQTVKGWKALQTKGLHLLTRHEGQVRIALSGTPVLNSPLEFFSVLKFLGMLKETARTTFEKYYGVWSFDYWGHYVCTGYKNLEHLAELLKPIICIAKKDELSLPTKTRKLVHVELGCYKDDFSYLEKCYVMTSSKLYKHGFNSKPEVRAKMVYLSSIAEGKLKFIANKAALGKMLVFSQYTTVLDYYRQKLLDLGFKVGYYTGELSMRYRLVVLDKWREGDFDVLLLSLNAARYGLNLTEAKQVVFLEPPSSLTVLEQAEDRSHRIGQTEPVVSYLLSATPIDERALEIIIDKQHAIDELLSKL